MAVNRINTKGTDMLTLLVIAAALTALAVTAYAAHSQIDQPTPGRHRPGSITPIDITGEIVTTEPQLALPAVPVKRTLKPGWQLDMTVPLDEVTDEPVTARLFHTVESLKAAELVAA